MKQRLSDRTALSILTKTVKKLFALMDGDGATRSCWNGTVS